MPNVWTHIVFGEKVVKEAGFSDLSDELKPYLRLGAQGPDPFFYHYFWPWYKKKPVTEVGQKIHYEECGPFLMEMIRYGKEHTHDTKLTAYILGFITHHILDRNTHPYIIYRSGNEGNRHQKLEIIIDTLLMKQWHGIETWKTPVYKQIDVGKQLYPSIHDMLKHLIESFFPGTANRMPAHFIEKSYQDMVLALRVLHDPHGWKNKLLKEKVAPFSYQKSWEDKDYLNLNRVAWLHPADDTEQSHKTFYELFYQAEREGFYILSHVKEYWSSGNAGVFHNLKELVGNRSYDTGKDCSLGLANCHFDPIL
jgi:hypothetical protein